LKNEKNRDVDTPTEQRLECTEETNQQYLDIGGHSGLEKARRNCGLERTSERGAYITGCYVFGLVFLH
jgi:hypothetical protein